MVHALEIARSLLKKDGLLIDIHPTGNPPQVEVHVDGVTTVAGHIQETDDFVEYFQANDALEDVTSRGLFELEREGLFTYLLHAPTISALADHLAAEWSDAVLDASTIERAAELAGEPGESAGGRTEIIMREIVQIARYRVIGR